MRYYARQLRAQANDRLEIRTCRYVRRRAYVIADELCVRLSGGAVAAHGVSVPFQRHAQQKPASEDGASDSSGEEIEQPTAPEYERLWGFLFDGPAFRALQQRLEAYAGAALTEESTLTRGQPMHEVHPLYSMMTRWASIWAFWREPGAAYDKSTRCCWTCVST
jgi:hypothetical protein